MQASMSYSEAQGTRQEERRRQLEEQRIREEELRIQQELDVRRRIADAAKRKYISGIFESLSQEIQFLPDASVQLTNLLLTQSKITSEALKERLYRIRESGSGSDDKYFDKEAAVLVDFHQSLGPDRDEPEDPDLLRLYLILLKFLSPKEIKSFVQLIRSSNSYSLNLRLKDQLSSIIDLLSWLSQNAYLTDGMKQAITTNHRNGCLFATTPAVIKKILNVLQAIQAATPPEKIEAIFIRFISCELTYPYPILMELIPDIPILIDLILSEESKITYASWHKVLKDSCKKFTMRELQSSETSTILNNYLIALRYCYERHIEPPVQLFDSHQPEDFESLINDLDALNTINRLDNVTAFVLLSLRTKVERIAYIQTIGNISEDKWHTSADNSFTAVSPKTSDLSFLMEQTIEEWSNINKINSGLMNRILLGLYKKHHHDQICCLTGERAALDVDRFFDTAQSKLLVSKLLDSYHAAIYKREIIQIVETYYRMHQIGLPVIYSTSTSLQEPCIQFVMKENNNVCFDPPLPMPEALKNAIAALPYPVIQEAHQKQLEEKLYHSLLKKLSDLPNPNSSFVGHINKFDERLKQHLDTVDAYDMKKSRSQALQQEIQQQKKTIKTRYEVLGKEFNQNYQDPNPSWYNKHYPLIKYITPFRKPSYMAFFIGFVMLITGFFIPLIALPFLIIGPVILGVAALTIVGTALIEKKIDPMIKENIEVAEKLKYQTFQNQFKISPERQALERAEKALINEKYTIDRELSQFDCERERLVKEWTILISSVNEPYRASSSETGMFSRKETLDLSQMRQRKDAAPATTKSETNSTHARLRDELERDLRDPNSWHNQTRRRMDAERADPNSETNRAHARLRDELERDLRDPNSWYNQTKRNMMS